MKQILRYTFLLLSILVIGGGRAFADEETAYKTLTFPSDTYDAVQGYESTWKATMGTDEWSIYAFNNNKFGNNWTYIKCGRNKYESVAYIANTSAFDKAISKIVVTIDAITANKVNSIYLQVCSDAACTSQVEKVKLSSLTKGDKEFTITNPSPSYYYKLVFDCQSHTSNGFVQVSKVAYYAAADDGKTATTTSFTGITGTTYTSTVNQTISASASVKADEATVSGANVTYKSSNEKIATVDANGSVTTIAPGSAVITALYDGDDTHSASAASFTLTVKGEYSTIADMQSAIDKLSENGVTSIAADITFKDVYVTGVNGKNAYISDGSKGMLIYTDGHGLTEGNKIDGTAKEVTLTLYKGAYEITGFSSSDLTISDSTLTATVTAISSISAASIGNYVIIKNVTYDATNKKFTDSEKNTIAYYDGLKKSVSLIDGNTYDVTGVVGYSDAPQFMPTAATALSKAATLTIADHKTSLNVDATDTYTITYDGDGTVSVVSSDTNVATAAYDSDTKTVTITAVANGETTITISATAGANYGIPSPISYDLDVKYEGELTETFNASDNDIDGKGTSGGGAAIVADRTNVSLNASSAYKKTSNTYLQIYSKSSITITAKEGYIISGVKLTANSTSNIKTWNDQDDNVLAINGETATWSGISTSTVITNSATAQAQLTSIEVSYLPLTESGSVEIGTDGKATYCATANCIIGDGTVAKYIIGAEENSSTLTEVDAPIIAAGEGVLLSGEAGSYKVYTHTKLAPTKNANNKLVGCSSATTVPAGAYVMQKQDNCVAFYIVSETASITCPAGKAYLQAMSTEAKALFFYGDEATGIGAVEANAEETNGDIYTLSGVKVNKANLTKGIYIVNGKKYIVR